MAYADYQFYKNQYFGSTIAESDFPRLAERASAYIDNITMGRSVVYAEKRDELKKACCAVAEAYLKNEQGGGVVSETVGKLTRNYAAGISNTMTERQRLYTAATQYLGMTGILYRGGF